jgi:prolyl-tRNA editing enzyme YbaK/EbsC (Cys-tRNA(Pro) deacylase)
MSESLSSSAKRVQDALGALGLTLQVVELPQSTRTAVEAASAIGCGVEQIAKSVVFRTRSSKRPVLVIASGTNRVNEKRVGALVGEPLERADADFVRERTGFAIGGIPPVGHLEQIETYIDEDLLTYGEIWAAAGNPNAVFRLVPADLERMSGGKVTGIK